MSRQVPGFTAARRTALIRYAALLPLASLLASCAALGTRARIFPGIPAQEIRTIGFMVVSGPLVPASSFGHAIDSLFTEQLGQQLTQISGREVYFIGTLRKGRIDVAVADSLAQAHPHLDAIALATIRVSASRPDLTGRGNAAAQVHLLKTAERALLARTRFNTRMGKSYWLEPQVPEAIQDATKGVVAPFRRYFVQK